MTIKNLEFNLLIFQMSNCTYKTATNTYQEIHISPAGCNESKIIKSRSEFFVPSPEIEDRDEGERNTKKIGCELVYFNLNIG
jgi:hypothetical protein